ncbi:hypothetical protein [Armatimonas sp.]|uniref:hypothetical protein n=1 Tax=Armatimonas sp. TaxID=1872638 RepID=UPI003752E68E
MKRLNVLAASLIAATLVTLSLLPLTREALRFDMQLAAGKPILVKALTDLGIKLGNLGAVSQCRAALGASQVGGSPGTRGGVPREPSGACDSSADGLQERRFGGRRA